MMSSSSFKPNYESEKAAISPSSLSFFFLLSNLKDHFNEMDTNKDGFVDFNELQTWFDTNEIDYGAELKEFFDQIDAN